MQVNQKARYDQHAKDLTILKAGDAVLLQNPETGKWDDEGMLEKKVRKRTYRIELQNGRITHRNRRKIKTRDVSLIESPMSEWTKNPKAKEQVDEEADSKPRRS